MRDEHTGAVAPGEIPTNATRFGIFGNRSAATVEDAGPDQPPLVFAVTAASAQRTGRAF